MRVSGYDSSSISMLFSSLPGSSDGNNLFQATTGMLSDYYSIRNGSYQKALRSYYNSDEAPKVVHPDKTSKKDTYKQMAQELKELKESATDLYDASNKLLAKDNKSLFKKTSSTDAEGKVTYDYDKDKIYQGVKAFVEDYNRLLAKGADSSDKSVTRSVEGMKSATNMNERMLNQLGITADKSGKLSVDEATFKNGDMTLAKSLFQSQGGYAYQIASKASSIQISAMSQASGGSYTSTGALSMNDLFNTYNSYI